MGFNVNNYVEVSVRVKKFWNEYPDGRIKTLIIKWEGSVVGIKASIYKDLKEDKYPTATGHAYEKEGSTFVNETSYVENCETSAIGRALGIMGYEIKKGLTSREEAINAKLQQEDIKRAEKAEAITPKIKVVKDNDLELKKESKEIEVEFNKSEEEK